jgi:hypothetical protein
MYPRQHFDGNSWNVKSGESSSESVSARDFLHLNQAFVAFIRVTPSAFGHSIQNGMVSEDAIIGNIT